MPFPDSSGSSSLQTIHLESSHNFLLLFSRLAVVDADAVWREVGGEGGGGQMRVEDSVDTKL